MLLKEKLRIVRDLIKDGYTPSTLEEALWLNKSSLIYYDVNLDRFFATTELKERAKELNDEFELFTVRHINTD